MLYTSALLALVAAVSAQTPGFHAIGSPHGNLDIKPGETIDITWVPGSVHPGPVYFEIIGGPTDATLEPIAQFGEVDGAAGSYSWTVPQDLGSHQVYGLKIVLKSDPTVFQYSMPFHIGDGVVSTTDQTSATATTTDTHSTSATSSASTTNDVSSTETSQTLTSSTSMSTMDSSTFTTMTSNGTITSMSSTSTFTTTASNTTTTEPTDSTVPTAQGVRVPVFGYPALLCVCAAVFYAL